MFSGLTNFSDLVQKLGKKRLAVPHNLFYESDCERDVRTRKVNILETSHRIKQHIQGANFQRSGYFLKLRIYTIVAHTSAFAQVRWAMMSLLFF